MRKYILLAALLFLLPSIASALGLGKISLHSELNQPFSAQIPLLGAQRLPLDNIKASFAPKSDFQRFNIEYSPVLNKLKVQVSEDNHGNPVVEIKSHQPIQQSFLQLLISVDWGEGQIVREYTVLLDLPQTLANAPATQVKPSESSVRSQPPIQPTFTENEYGLTKPGDYLWKIAELVRPSDQVTIEQTMLALLHTNPKAFYADNINALSAGFRLKVPSIVMIQQLSKLDALDEVSQQNYLWKNDRAKVAKSKPVSQNPKVIKTSQPYHFASQVTQGLLTSRLAKKPVNNFEQRQSQPANEVIDTEKNQMEVLPEETAATDKINQLNAELMRVNQEASVAKQSNQLLQEKLVALSEQNQVLNEKLAKQDQQIGKLYEMIAELQQSPGIGQAYESKSTPFFAKMTWLVVAIIALLLIAFYLLWRQGMIRKYLAKLRQRNVENFADTNEVVMQIPAANESEVEKETHAPVEHHHRTRTIVDAIEKADIYLAHQRFELAENELLAAIEQIPQRIDLKVKLLEVYANSQNSQKFSRFLQNFPDDFAIQYPDQHKKVQRLKLQLGIELQKEESQQHKPSLSAVEGLVGDDLVATKLDLARAYIGMGDKSVAEDILQEILAEGDDAQQMKAQELLQACNQ